MLWTVYRTSLMQQTITKLTLTVNNRIISYKILLDLGGRVLIFPSLQFNIINLREDEELFKTILRQISENNEQSSQGIWYCWNIKSDIHEAFRITFFFYAFKIVNRWLVSLLTNLEFYISFLNYHFEISLISTHMIYTLFYLIS